MFKILATIVLISMNVHALDVVVDVQSLSLKSSLSDKINKLFRTKKKKYSDAPVIFKSEDNNRFVINRNFVSERIMSDYPIKTVNHEDVISLPFNDEVLRTIVSVLSGDFAVKDDSKVELLDDHTFSLVVEFIDTYSPKKKKDLENIPTHAVFIRSKGDNEFVGNKELIPEKFIKDHAVFFSLESSKYSYTFYLPFSPYVVNAIISIFHGDFAGIDGLDVDSHFFVQEIISKYAPDKMENLKNIPYNL